MSITSTTALNNGETYSSGWLDAEDFLGIVVAVKTDQDGVLYIDQSPDGTNTDSTLSYSVTASTNEVHRLTKTRRFMQVRFTNNSGSNQTYFRIQHDFGDYAQLSSPLNSTIQQDADSQIVRSVPSNIELALGRYQNHLVVEKFGYNASVSNTLTDIWSTGGVLAQPTSAQSVEILSSSTNDTSGGSGAQKVTVYGLDSNWNLVEEEVTMAGQSVAAVTQTFLRVFRLRVTQRGTYATANAGTITCRIASGGTTLATIPYDSSHLGMGTSQMTHYTVPAGYTGLIMQYIFNIEASKPVDVVMRYRGNDGTFSGNIPGTIFAPKRFGGQTGTVEKTFAIPLSFPAKSDLWVQAIATGATTGFVSVLYQLVLVKD